MKPAFVLYVLLSDVVYYCHTRTYLKERKSTILSIRATFFVQSFSRLQNHSTRPNLLCIHSPQNLFHQLLIILNYNFRLIFSYMGKNYEVDLIDVQKFQVQKLGAT